eukprot:10873807-Ditylum_brightwellii.AAC.1
MLTEIVCAATLAKVSKKYLMVQTTNYLEGAKNSRRKKTSLKLKKNPIKPIARTERRKSSGRKMGRRKDHADGFPIMANTIKLNQRAELYGKGVANPAGDAKFCFGNAATKKGNSIKRKNLHEYKWSL